MKLSLLFLLIFVDFQWHQFVHGIEAEESGDSESGVESDDGSTDEITKRSRILNAKQNIYQPVKQRYAAPLTQQKQLPQQQQLRAAFQQPSDAYTASQVASAISARSNEEPSYPEIINKSLEILLKDLLSPKEVKEVLMKHYFTDKKEDSIWPKAIEETEKQLNLVLEIRELSDMENDVKAIYRRMLECDLMLEGTKTKKALNKSRRHYANCYVTLRDFIDDGYTDFGFPRGTVEGQAKMLQMNLAYQMMSLLTLRMTQAICENAGVTSALSAKVARSIFDIAENTVMSIKKVTKETVDARIQAVSPIEICLVHEILWQELTDTCEFRMKRDVDTGAGIGGPADKFKQKFRAKVIDAVTKKEVCNIAMSTNENQDKDDVKRELTKKCAKLRDSYARNIKKEISKFFEDRITTVAKGLPKLWNSDEKKLKEIKEKLDSKSKN